LTTDVLADGDWKLVDRHGAIKQTPKILSVQYFELGGDQLDSDRSMWARTGDGWGLINADGAWNVPPKYQQVGQLIHGLAAVRLNNKWGYLSRSGDVAIETQFDEARAFSENRLAAVKVGNLWGYIDITGAAVIKPQFDRSEAFGGDGYAAVSTNNMWGMIDQSGRWIIEPLYDRISHDHKDIAWVETKGKLGAFDLSGRLIVAPQFSQLPALCEDGWIIGFADGHQLIVRDQRKPPMASNIELAGSNCEDPFRVREGGGFTFLDRNLQRISEKKFDAALLFSEHAAAVQVGGKFGYVDRDGRWTIEPRFDDAQAFRKGIAIVKVKDKFGYVRVDGTWLAEPEFEEAAPFEDGFAIVVRGGKRGVIDSKGAWVAATALRHFDSSLDKGLVPFSVAGQWGFADAAGAVVIEPRYDAVTPFSRGLAWTKSGGDWCPIDRQAHKIPKISCQGDMPKPSFALRSWPY
jgi:hypothetical protein